VKIELRSIVTVSDMRKNYKACREKAQTMGKVYIFKNNRADAVLSSIDDYRKLELVLDHIEGMNEEPNMVDGEMKTVENK
jgi:PHD/YefM family antitoxin component YafN of YafNO toxin-antitoxin module